MAIVEFLPAFFASCVEGRAVGHYYVVTAVCGRIENGFVFSHQEDRDAGGESAEGGRCDERVCR